MRSNGSISQKIGWWVFALGSLAMVGLGWLYSWQVVPAANQIGGEAYSGLLGFAWQLSVPIGSFIVAIGAALAARVERRTIWLLVILLAAVIVWKIVYSSGQMISALFGVGGGLIVLFFIGSTWQWAKIRPTLNKAGRTGSDLRMIGTIFFVMAAWFLCGDFGVGNYILRPELAVKFSVPTGDTINLTTFVMVMLVLGWGFTFFGQLVSHQEPAAQAELAEIPQVVAAD